MRVHIVCRVSQGLTEDSEVLDEVLNVGGEALAASRTGEDVGGAQIHEAALAEGVATLEDAGDLILVVVLVVADWAGHVHEGSSLFKFIINIAHLQTCSRNS